MALKRSESLIEFIENIKPKGSVKVFIKGREEEGVVEDGRIEELAKKQSTNNSM